MLFQKPKTLGQKIETAVQKIPGHHQSTLLNRIQHLLVYLAVYLAGFVTALALRLLSLT